MIKFTITAGQTLQPASAANIVARLGIVANADPTSTIYQLAIGQDAAAALSAGPAAVDAAYASTWSGAQQIVVKVQASTAGTISSVTKPMGSTSPTPTIAGSSFDGVTNSPFDAYTLALQYSGGAPGACSVNIALDGASYNYTYPLPAALPATLRGTVDVTGFTWASLDNLTLRWKPDGGAVVTVTFGSSVAGEADVLTAFAAQPTVAAGFVQVGDKRYLQVAGITQGSAGSLDFMGGSAEDLLGFVPSVAVQRSTVDVASAFTFSTLDNETLIFTPDGGSLVTATMGASVAAEADILTAFSGHATLVAYFVHTGAHHYLEVAALTPGLTGALLSGAGTANTNLGFTGAPPTHGSATGLAAGVDSSVSIPGTGLRVTFPFGTYLPEIHTATTTAPRHSKADFDAALAVLNGRFDLAFGLAELVQEPLDATDLASYVADTDSTAAAWEAQPNKRFVHFLVPAPTGLADAAVAAALTGESGRYTTVAARWTYMDTSRGLPQGSMPRSTCRALSTRCASIPYSEDPGFGGFGPLPACHMIGPDGSSLAPDENTATTKLGTSKGPGYTVVKGKAISGQLLPYFVRGVTRAGQTSLFVDLGVTRMVLRAAAIIYGALQTFENPTFDLQADGTIQEADATPLEDAWRKALLDELVPQHASAADVAILRTEDIGQTRNLTVNYTVQERGQGEDITATLTLTGTLAVES